jgi:hypothetical protein
VCFSREKRKFHRNTIRCSEDMNSNAIKVSLFRSNVTTIVFGVDNPASGYTDIITYRNRERINYIF